MMNNFNFVLSIYLIILLQTKTSYIFIGKHFLQHSSSKGALAGAACGTMAQQVEDRVGLHGRTGC